MERINPAIINRDHPEGVCQECGGPNISWWADSALFNSVADRAEILCPLCFAGRITQRPELMHSLELRAAPRSRADGPRTAEMFTRAEIDSVIARAEKAEADRDQAREDGRTILREKLDLLAERDQLRRELARVESGLYEDMRDELVAENARLEVERDQAKHVAANHWTYAMRLKEERDQAREQLDVAREQHDNITRAMQERIEQAKAERDQLQERLDELAQHPYFDALMAARAERDKLRMVLTEIEATKDAWDESVERDEWGRETREAVAKCVLDITIILKRLTRMSAGKDGSAYV